MFLTGFNSLWKSTHSENADMSPNIDVNTCKANKGKKKIEVEIIYQVNNQISFFLSAGVRIT